MFKYRLFTLSELYQIVKYHVAFLLTRKLNKNLIEEKNIIQETIRLNYRIKKEGNYFIIWNKNSKIKLRKNTSDINVFKQIFIEEEYKPIISFVAKNNISIKNIIDCGANIGLSSLYFSINFKQVHCICIEPFEKNMELLKENLKFNNFEDSIPILGGIWYKKISLFIDRSFRDGKEWAVSLKESNDFGKIKGMTINELITDYNLQYIDILKIDIEGAESLIFDENISNVSFLQKTKIIALEIHDEFNCRNMIVNLLKKYNFCIDYYGELLIGYNEHLI